MSNQTEIKSQLMSIMNQINSQLMSNEIDIKSNHNKFTKVDTNVEYNSNQVTPTVELIWSQVPINVEYKLHQVVTNGNVQS